jgi:hypothetical protein
MKSISLVFLCCLSMLLGACSKGTDADAKTPEPTAVQITTTTTPDSNLAPPQGTPIPPEPTALPAPTEVKRSLYDPSIFVIEAKGSWQIEIAPGYFADYECEIYLHKIDANDNRAVAGSYQGVFWMQTSLDTAEYIKEMLGDVPIDMSFDAGGEAVSDNLGISLNTSDDKAWTDYSILGEDGNPLPLTQDTPVGKGSFVAIAKEIYLVAKAQGAQGEKVDYSSEEGSGDEVDINYVIHVEPDEMESGNTRKVTIHLSGEGFSQVIEGEMRRLPGYPEDVSDYLNSPAYQNSTWSKLQ